MTVPGGPGAVLVIPDDADPPPDVVEAWLASALFELPQPLRLQAALVAFDLMAGARMSGTAPFVVRLSVIESGCTLAVSVDACSNVDVGDTPDPEALLVAGLSGRWGVERRAGGRTLWAVISSGCGSISLRAPDQPRPWDLWFR